MNKKKGFTLVELLAAVVIVGFLLAIIIPSIKSMMNNSKDSLYDTEVAEIEKAARVYAIKNIDAQYFEEYDIAYVTIQQLSDQGFIDTPINNPKTGENFDEDYAVRITKASNGVYSFEFLNDIASSDNLLPVITLLGNSTVSIYVGDAYTDAGATAIDNVDGDITSNIVITNNVNVNVAGTYTITYNVSDSAENDAITVSRTVNVLSNYIASEGVNRPRLASGMIAIKWNGSSWVGVSSPNTDTTWYNYANKEWANAKTSDGSYWVWIPRYIYKIGSGWHSSTEGTINVQFSMETDDTRGATVTLDTGTTSNASNNKWTNHPAFTFGTSELTGIWVAKFEASAVEGLSNNVFTMDGSCVAGDDVTTKTIKIIPNARSWRCIKNNNIFTNIRNMETKNIYGWGTTGNNIDTHMMRNSEWGAVAYLSRSSYGKEADEIWINPADNYLTGCAGDSVTSAPTTGCLRTYSTTNGIKASTTGNVYGIYDISGGAYERMAAYVNNGDSSLNTYGSNILNANAKYREVYSMGSPDDMATNYGLAINKKGDAIYETSGSINGDFAWFDDYSMMPNSINPFSVNGGYFYFDHRTGPFAFSRTNGNVKSCDGFRPVLVVKAGL